MLGQGREIPRWRCIAHFVSDLTSPVHTMHDHLLVDSILIALLREGLNSPMKARCIRGNVLLCGCRRYKCCRSQIIAMVPGHATQPWDAVEIHLMHVGLTTLTHNRFVARACLQFPVRSYHLERTAFITSTCKYCFKHKAFGPCNDPWLLTEMAESTIGHISELLIHMDDLCILSSRWIPHIQSLEAMPSSLQTAGLTLEPCDVEFGPTLDDYPPLAVDEVSNVLFAFVLLSKEGKKIARELL